MASQEPAYPAQGYDQQHPRSYGRGGHYQGYDQQNPRSYGRGGNYQDNGYNNPPPRSSGFSNYSGQGYNQPYSRSNRDYSQGYDQQHPRSYGRGGHYQGYDQQNPRSYGRGGNYQGNYQQPSSSRYDEYQDDTTVSRKLSNILRHTAEKLNLKMDSNGFVFVDDLLKIGRFNNVNQDDIKRIVKENDKQRFSLKTDEITQKLKVRANQGHSLKFENLDLELTPIDDAEKYPNVLHGTYYQYWNTIRKEGLKRMKRVHIHFAPGLPGENQVISGMRTTCDVLIYMDLKKAIEDGLKFFLSTNNVILSSGDKDGVIAPKYFSKVVDRKLGKPLSMDESSPRRFPVGMVVDDKSQNSKKKSKLSSPSQSKPNLPVGMSEEDFFKHQTGKNQSKKMKKDSEAKKNASENKQNPKEKTLKQEKKDDGEKDNVPMDEDDKNSGSKGQKSKKPKKESDAEKNSPDLHDGKQTGMQKTDMKNANLKDNDKSKEPLQTPNVIFIENNKDEHLNQLKDQAALGVHTIQKEGKILYILISLPGTVFIFDPKVTNEFLKTLFENDKCEKVMFDCSLVFEIYQQWKLVLYKKKVVDISLLHFIGSKRLYDSLGEMIGEELGKTSMPEMIKPLKKMVESGKTVKKNVTQCSHLVTLYKKEKSHLDDDTRAKIFEKYNGKFDEDTKLELED